MVSVSEDGQNTFRLGGVAPRKNEENVNEKIESSKKGYR